MFLVNGNIFSCQLLARRRWEVKCPSQGRHCPPGRLRTENMSTSGCRHQSQPASRDTWRPAWECHHQPHRAHQLSPGHEADRVESHLKLRRRPDKKWSIRLLSAIPGEGKRYPTSQLRHRADIDYQQNAPTDQHVVPEAGGVPVSEVVDVPLSLQQVVVVPPVESAHVSALAALTNKHVLEPAGAESCSVCSVIQLWYWDNKQLIQTKIE